MPRITKVTTRTGDDGTTALGTGQRVRKDSPRIQACGAIDELNAQLGVVLAHGGAPAPCALAPELIEPLQRIQNDLFHLGADLTIPEPDKPAHPGPRIEERHLAALDEWIERFNSGLPPLRNFVLPGGVPAAAVLHVARAICRLAECTVVALAAVEPVGPHIIPYLNRLSDLLFVLSRVQNRYAGVPEPTWDSRA